jgi:hypothetical protein
VCLAAEAVKKALVFVDRERGRLLVVEGTEGDVLATPLDETDAAADHVGERYARAQLVKESRREGHCATVILAKCPRGL